jgi:hypothetical protein
MQSQTLGGAVGIVLVIWVDGYNCRDAHDLPRHLMGENRPCV